MQPTGTVKFLVISIAIAFCAGWTSLFPTVAEMITGVPLRENDFLLMGTLFLIWAIVIGLILTSAIEQLLPAETDSTDTKVFRLFLRNLSQPPVRVRPRNRRVRL